MAAQDQAGNSCGDLTILFDRVIEEGLTTELVPILLAWIEEGDFNAQSATILYSILMTFNNSLLESLKNLRENEEKMIEDLEEKSKRNQAEIDLCCRCINLAASPGVIRNFTSSQQQFIRDWKLSTENASGKMSHVQNSRFTSNNLLSCEELQKQLEKLKKEKDELWNKIEETDTIINLLNVERERIKEKDIDENTLNESKKE